MPLYRIVEDDGYISLEGPDTSGLAQKWADSGFARPATTYERIWHHLFTPSLSWVEYAVLVGIFAWINDAGFGPIESLVALVVVIGLSIVAYGFVKEMLKPR